MHLFNDEVEYAEASVWRQCLSLLIGHDLPDHLGASLGQGERS